MANVTATEKQMRCELWYTDQQAGIYTEILYLSNPVNWEQLFKVLPLPCTQVNTNTHFFPCVKALYLTHNNELK